MNEQLKIKMTDDVQKAMTRSCQRSCKSIKNTECFQTCYEKYIRTVGAVNKTIKKLSYQKHSLFGYKGYPEPSIQSAFYYDDLVMFNMPGKAPFAYNRDYAA